MLRTCRTLQGIIYCRVCDTSRLEDFQARGMRSVCGYPVKIDLGTGVNKMNTFEAQTLIDNFLGRSAKFATVKTGRVTDTNGFAVEFVEAGKKYIVSGSMKGGIYKPDLKFGPRLTGCHGATSKPGLRHIGDDL